MVINKPSKFILRIFSAPPQGTIGELKKTWLEVDYSEVDRTQSSAMKKSRLEEKIK